MAVIKSHNAATLLKEAIVLDLGDIARQGEKLRAAAEDKARRIVADAEAQGRSLTANAREEGLAQGRAEGMEKGLQEGRAQGRAEALAAVSAELKQLQEAWSAALAQWDAQRQELDREARQAVLRLALRLAERVTHRAVAVDPQTVVRQVAAALAHVLRPLDVTVRVGPDDRAILQDALPGLLAAFPKLQHVALVDDPAMTRGGCVVTYGQGLIDATVETQLRRIAELLLPGAGDNPPAGSGSVPDKDTDVPAR